MGVPFFADQSGDTAKIRRAILAQTLRGIPADEAAGTYREFRSYGSGFVRDRQVIERQAISSDGEPFADLRGKIGLEPVDYPFGDVDPADQGQLHALANLFGAYSVGDAPASASVKRFKFAKGEASDPGEWMTMLDSDDILPITRFHGVQCGRIVISAGPSENLRMVAQLAAEGFTYAGIVSQETGTGSTLPVISKTWPGNWADDADDADIWIKITVAPDGAGAFTYQAGLSGATAPTYSDTRTGQLGTWNRLFDTDGSRIGVKAEQPAFYVPTGGTLALNDEFRVPKRRALSTFPSTLGVSQAISSVNSSLIIDGVEERVEGGWTLTLGYATFQVVPDTPGEQDHTIERSGIFSAELALERVIADVTYQKRLAQATSVQGVIDAETESVIGATIYPHRFAAMLPKLTLRGGMYAPNEGATNRRENPTLRAAPPDTNMTYAAESGDMVTGKAVAIFTESTIAAL